VFGIDTEEQRLHDFIENIGRDMKYKILNASVEKMPFPDEHFLFVTSFEVLEHVSDLGACTNELVRVLARGGVLVVSVPHVLFPVENHGIRVGRYVFEGKIPFLPYLRPLHKMCSLARVFSSTEMDRLFIERKLELLETAYASPQFERAAANPSSWESKLAFLRPVLDKFESVPLLRALSGVSMLKAFRKSP
jgi:ubiquinone/menaquinone biosynthesis C-methylase UbiE